MEVGEPSFAGERNGHHTECVGSGYEVSHGISEKFMKLVEEIFVESSLNFVRLFKVLCTIFLGKGAHVKYVTG